MKKLTLNGKTFHQFDYSLESEFEEAVIQNKDSIFGKNGIYYAIKKLIGKSKDSASIPDGYYLDLKYRESPILYFVEAELDSHDIYTHIAPQIFKFATNTLSETDTIIDNLKKATNPADPALLDFFAHSTIKNIDELLYRVVKKIQMHAIVIINKSSQELVDALSMINLPLTIIEFSSYKCGDEIAHLFDPLDSEVIDSVGVTEDKLTEEEQSEIEALDTIVVPARQDGFNETFIGENCWYAIRISTSMLSKIKYIAAYITAPDSRITHFAEVDKIIRYVDPDTGKTTDKYKLIFKGPAQEIGPIVHLKEKDKRKVSMQRPRYTTFEKLKSAHTLGELFF
jgi:hypothetical protein